MNRTVYQWFFIVFSLFIFQIPAYCGPAYSLYELAQLANKHSETIKIAKEDVFIAQQEKKRALSVLIPKATSFGSVTEFNDDNVSKPDTQTIGVKLTQSFTLNGKELIALDVTKKDIKGKQFSLQTIRSQYFLQVARAYYNILSAQKFLEIALSDVKRLTIHRDAVKERLRVGNVTKTDLFRSQAELSKSLTEKVRAENRLVQTKADMHNLVELEDDFKVQQEDIDALKNYNGTLKDIQSHALKNRAEIKKARKNLEIARQTIDFKKSDYWPKLSLEAGYRETQIQYDTTLMEIKQDTEDLFFTGELVFTLYDGGLRKAQINQALAGQRKAENALTLERRKVILESQTSFLDYKTAEKALLNLHDELKAAQENFNAVKMQFQYGMADSIDMMDANTLLVTAQRKISDARYTYFFAVLKILYTKGNLISFLLNQG